MNTPTRITERLLSWWIVRHPYRKQSSIRTRYIFNISIVDLKSCITSPRIPARYTKNRIYKCSIPVYYLRSRCSCALLNSSYISRSIVKALFHHIESPLWDLPWITSKYVLRKSCTQSDNTYIYIQMRVSVSDSTLKPIKFNQFTLLTELRRVAWIYSIPHCSICMHKRVTQPVRWLNRRKQYWLLQQRKTSSPLFT